MEGGFLVIPPREQRIMKQYAIYFNPSDYPDKYVVRGWTIEPGPEPIPDEEPHFVCNTLEAARLSIPGGLIPLARSLRDDPVLVEVWI